MKKVVILLSIILLFSLSSCEDVLDIMINDVEVTCTNKTTEPMVVLFSATDYPFPTVYDIATNNTTPTLVKLKLNPGQTGRVTIYCAEKFDVWYMPYKMDGKVYGGGGKLLNQNLTIE